LELRIPFLKGEEKFELYEFFFRYRLPYTKPMRPTPRRIKLEGSGVCTSTLSLSRMAPPSKQLVVQ